MLRPGDESVEPLLNQSAIDLTVGKGLGIVATDGQGNALLVDALSWEMRFDYTGGPTSTEPVYIGYANPGTATSTATWLVHKFTYTGGVVTRRQVATGSWDGRSGLFP